jgi:hypothetical protein
LRQIAKLCVSLYLLSYRQADTIIATHPLLLKASLQIAGLITAQTSVAGDVLQRAERIDEPILSHFLVIIGTNKTPYPPVSS